MDTQVTVTLGEYDGDPYLLLADGEVLVRLKHIKPYLGPVARESLDKWVAEQLARAQDIAHSPRRRRKTPDGR